VRVICATTVARRGRRARRPRAALTRSSAGDGAGEPLDAVGVLFAGIAAAGWAGYIVLTKHVGARWAGLEGLAISMGVAALLAAPFGIAVAGSALLELDLLLEGAALALLLPLLPYVFELIALRRLPTALFGVIMSLEPAIGATWGYLLLDQALTSSGIVAIGFVVIASAGATLMAREPPLPGAEDHAPAHGR
jgi:inner membrane transporter RhtA